MFGRLNVETVLLRVSNNLRSVEESLQVNICAVLVAVIPFLEIFLASSLHKWLIIFDIHWHSTGMVSSDSFECLTWKVFLKFRGYNST